MSSIKVNQLSFSYGRVGNASSSPMVLNKINLELIEGDRVGLIGRNGCGKSTFLQCIAGNLPVAPGAVEVSGQMLALIKRSSNLLPRATLVENSMLKAYSLGLTKAAALDYSERVLKLSGLENRRDSSLDSLSTGMRGKFTIALNAMVSSDIMIFDEWVGTLNVSAGAKGSLLEQVISSADIVVLASHNDRLIRQLCNRLVLLDDGCVRYDGRDFDAGFDELKRIKQSRANFAL